MKTYQPHIASIGDMAANALAVLCYIFVLSFWTLGSILALAVFLLEKNSGLVRFHAMQALLFWLARGLLGGGITYESLAALLTGNVQYLHMSYGWMSGMGVVALRLVIDGFFLALAIMAMMRAYHWQDWKIPLIGQCAAWVCGFSRKALYVGVGPVPRACMMDPEKKVAFHGESRQSQMEQPQGKARQKKQPLHVLDKNDIAQIIYIKTSGGENIYAQNDEDDRAKAGQSQPAESEAGNAEKEMAGKRNRKYRKSQAQDASWQLPKGMQDRPWPEEYYSEAWEKGNEPRGIFRLDAFPQSRLAAATLENKEDPNSALPPGMRDGPAPTDIY